MFALDLSRNPYQSFPIPLYSNLRRIMKTSRTLLLTLGALLTWSVAQATTVIPPTFDQLVDRAEVIFQGTVTGVSSQWTGEGSQRHIVTFVTFKVDESIKGEAGATYTMRMLGGTVGDQTMEVTDSPKFAAGDRDILFVENNGRQFVPLVGIMYGRFHVQQENGTGREIVATEHGAPVSDLAAMGREDAPAASKSSTPSTETTAENALSTADFKAAIRAKLAN